MFWNRGTPGERSSSITSSSIGRNVHLSSYLNHSVLKPSTRKVSNDDTIYDTVFQTTNGFALILRVYLPADSGRAPSMTLHGVRASHAWLDIRMKVIGYGPISTDARWRSSNLKLGDAVYAVIHHFQLTPPSIMEITDANLRRLQESLPGPPNTFPPSASDSFQRTNGSMNLAPTRPVTQPKPTPPPPPIEIAEKIPNFEVDARDVNALIPPLPSSFIEIDNMPMSGLKQIVDDPIVLDRFVENTSGVKTLKELKQSIETANVNASKANLANEEKIKNVCDEVETLKKDLGAKIEQYRKLDAERLALTHPPDLQEAIGELTKAKKDAYRESEEMADDWVESGGENVSNFVKEFMEVRLLYHTRAAKSERLGMSM